MKKNKLLLVSGILGAAYLIYLIVYFGGGIANSDGVDAIAGGIAAAIVMPHMICAGIAALFNWIGWGMSARWAALVAGIMYVVSIFCMFIYAPFVVVQAVLCFVAFAKLGKEAE